MQYEKDAIPVCEACLDKEQKSCAKCGVAYCEHFASFIDIRFCGNCMRAVTLTVETEIRTTEHHNDAGVMTYKKRDVCKRLRLSGTDYFFAAYQISELGDEDLDTAIEYHKGIMSAMVMEREDRKVEKYQKISRMVLGTRTARTDVDSTGAVKGSLKTEKQKADSKTTTTRATKKNDSNAIMDALSLLMKQGMTQEMIANLTKKGV